MKRSPRESKPFRTKDGARADGAARVDPSPQAGSVHEGIPDAILACPVCGGRLFRQTTALRCAAGHSHDLSGKGHANLLPGSHRGGSGDSADMVRARRRFLGAGWYGMLRDALCDEVRTIADLSGPSPAWLDCGCGEGWYTCAMDEALRQARPEGRTWGTDISKDAVRLAAGRSRNAFFFVSSVFRLPVLDQSLDAVSVIFAPLAADEIRRVLKPGGRLVLVTPGPKHLQSLKEILYATVIDNPPSQEEIEGFRRVSVREIRDSIRVSGIDRETGTPQVVDLLAMTPYYWRTPAEGVERLKKETTLETRVEFDVTVWEKR